MLAAAGFGAMVVTCGILGFADILGLFRLLEEEPDTLKQEEMPQQPGEKPSAEQ